MKRPVIFALALGLVWAIYGTAYGKIIHVPSEYPTIQEGIIAASPGDTVQVAPGTYYENITMKSGVVIQGAGAGDDPLIHSIIDGGQSGSVVTAIGVDSAAKLDGFKITNGKEILGGGMYNEGSSPTVSNCTFSGNSGFLLVGVGEGGGMYNASSSPTVTTCTFSGNDASGKGGGMYNANSSPTVSDCTFSSNDSSDQGGGMYNTNSSPTVTNCTFSENSSASWTFGGGMVNEYSSPTVIKCSFFNNSAGTFGGGMFNYSNSSPIVTSCIFSGNWAGIGGGGGGMCNQSSSPTVINCIFSLNNGWKGGGMFNWNSSPTVTNCTFWGNGASLGGSMYMESNSAPTVTNSILWGTTGLEEIWDWDGLSSFTYCDIWYWTSIYPGTGNINEDPLFVDEANGDFHLQQGSPCIDTGTNGAPDLPDTDFEGDPRIIDGDNDSTATVDMGIDEYYGVPAADIKANGSDGPITISPSDTLSVTVSLNSYGSTDNADWWLVANTDFGWYYYNRYSNSWTPGQSVSYQGSLFDLSPMEVLNMSGFPAGTYTFYFGVDTTMDGVVTWESLVYDSVEVNVIE